MPWIGVHGLPAEGMYYVSYSLLSILTTQQGTWKCVGVESGTVFPEVELEDGEWVDYDEKVCAISCTLSQPF